LATPQPSILTRLLYIRSAFHVLMIPSVSVVSAQPPQPQQEPAEWAEKLFGPPTNLVHDFGRVPKGTQLPHDFGVTNVYAEPIEITDIHPASCSPVTASANKHVLQPNEKATISVRMDGRRFSGQKTVAIYVRVGPLHISTAVLRVTAFTRDE
jgi:hypothetical protein